MLNQGISYLTGLDLYRKDIRLVDDIYDSTKQDFLPWEEAKLKFNLDDGEEEVWIDIICKIVDQWCNLLEADEDTAYPGHWLGFYTNGEKDPTFILRCNNDFTPICLQRYDIILPIPVQCSTVGTHSRCLRTWERPFGEFQGFFYMIKIIHTNRGPKKEGEQEDIIFFYGKKTSLGWDRIDGGGRTTGDFSTTLLRKVENLLPIITRVPHARKISGKVTFPVITSSISHKFGTHFGLVKKPHLCGQFGIKRSKSMSGGLASLRHPFLSNVYFVSRILANL